MDLSGVKFPFSISETIQSAFNLIASVNEFVLLGLAFLIIHPFVSLVFDAFRSIVYAKNVNKGREEWLNSRYNKRQQIGMFFSNAMWDFKERRRG